MALITRFTRLMRADFHAVLDRVEEPELLLRQAVREMEEALAQDETEIRRLQQANEQLESQQQQLAESLKDADAELDLCFESDNEDLARHLIRRQLETGKTSKSVQRRLAENNKVLAQRQQALKDDRSRYEAMRQKAEVLAEDSNTFSGFETHPNDFTVRDEEIEVALLREKSRRASS